MIRLLLCLCFLASVLGGPDERILINSGQFGVKIVGGKVSDDPRYKFIASLQRKIKGGWVHFCGGTLITPEYVLTAAHCVKYIGPDRVLIGVQNLEKGNQGETARVDEVIRHPFYSRGVRNDVALLKLKKPVRSIDPVLLNDIYQGELEENGMMLRTAGWGYLEENSGKLTNELHQVDVPVVSEERCAKKYSDLDNGKICAGFDEGGKDSCSGDSGGPLFYDDGARIRQVGVVSYGRGCARAEYYGVYARVSWFMEFIVETLKERKDTLPKKPVSKPTASPTTEDLSAEIRFCGNKKNQKKCEKNGDRCFWNGSEKNTVVNGLQLNKCFPLAQLQTRAPTSSPTIFMPAHVSKIFVDELNFCRKQKRKGKCKSRKFAKKNRYNSSLWRTDRCFWIDDNGTCESQFCNVVNEIVGVYAPYCL